VPLSPELVLDAGTRALDDCVEQVLALIAEQRTRGRR
jgi:adenylylsulfate kinase-like enzyme